MADVWTHGIWTVRPGREEAFLAARRAMARGAFAEFDPTARPHLFTLDEVDIDD